MEKRVNIGRFLPYARCPLPYATCVTDYNYSRTKVSAMSTFIHNAKIVFPGDRVEATTIRLEKGCIAAIGSAEPESNDEVVDGGGRLLTPGLIDLHVHGIEHFSFDNGADDLLSAARCFAKYGVTTVLPTLVPRRDRSMLDKLSGFTSAMDRVEGVSMPGLHLEGPFTAIQGAGCDLLSGDCVLLDEILSACDNKVMVMSLSPDTDNIIPVIEKLCEKNIVPFVTHTRASVEQSRAAIAAGARHATHLYDVFPVPAEKDPGVRPAGAVEVYMESPSATVDFIADGCHVDPVVIQLAVRAKKTANVAVITDANIGAGLPTGVYDTPWGYPVKVEQGNGARVADPEHSCHGMLAGSALTMNDAMANILKWLDGEPEDLWQMGTSTPARIAGLNNKGILKVGQDADLVLWNDNMIPFATWSCGCRAY